jgi:hypothetical protein
MLAGNQVDFKEILHRPNLNLLSDVDYDYEQDDD